MWVLLGYRLQLYGDPNVLNLLQRSVNGQATRWKEESGVEFRFGSSFCLTLPCSPSHPSYFSLLDRCGWTLLSSGSRLLYLLGAILQNI